MSSAVHAAVLALVMKGHLGNVERHRARFATLNRIVAARLPASWDAWRPVSDSAWTEGGTAVVTRALWGLHLVYLGVVLLMELGVTVPVVMLFLNSTIVWTSMASTRLTGLAMVMHTAVQTNNLLALPRQQPEWYMRAFYYSLLGNLLCIEPLDLMLYRLLYTAYVISALQNSYALTDVTAVLADVLNPTKFVFLLTLVSISVLGVRGRLAAMMERKQLHGFLILISLPSLFMLLAFSESTQAMLSTRELRRLQMEGAAAIVLGVVVLYAYTCTTVLSSGMFAGASQLTSTTVSVLWALTVAALLTAAVIDVRSVVMCIVLGVGTFKLPRVSRLCLLTVHGSRVALSSVFDDASFLCFLARQGLFFDSSPWALALAQELFMLGAALLLAPMDRGPIALMTLVSSALGSAMALNAKYSLDRVVDIETKSVNFVNHALKQKLVGAGQAIEHALNMYRAMPERHVAQLDAPMRALQGALHECRYSADRCHFSSVARVIGKGQYESKKYATPLAEAVDPWRTRLVNATFSVDDTLASVLVGADWDLCFGLVCNSMANGQGECVLGLDATKSELVMTTTSPNQSAARRRVEAERVIEKLLDELHARMDRSGDTVVWRVPVLLAPSANSPQLPMATAALLPAGLSMAVLDDNALSRHFMANFCQNELQSSTCLVRGETPADVESFIEEVVAAKPVISMCVLDQHLDWEGRVDVLGSDVASALRKRGYRGALVLHTASSVAKDVRGLENVDRYIFVPLSSSFRLTRGARFKGCWRNRSIRPRRKRQHLSRRGGARRGGWDCNLYHVL